MHRRQSLPRLWLFTDERLGDRLVGALERLPRGAGVVFRHYSLPAAERRALWERVRLVGRRRGLTLIVAGPALPSADGAHNRRGAGIRTWSAHNLRELRAAERAGAHLVFLSPVYSTATHPGAAFLGPQRFTSLARKAKVPVVALGGMDAEKARHLSGAYGWAGIDAWAKPAAG
ncbi:MAG TPA: thiamine phosphate synthase [Allosphingosinicella sp.]|jgi:thiamine-phosphate pyrophosphorylase